MFYSSAFAGDHGHARGGRRKSSAATTDSACANYWADEPYEAPKRKFWSEVGSLKQDRDHGLGRGAPSFAINFNV